MKTKTKNQFISECQQKIKSEIETKYTKGKWVIESTKMAGTDIVVQTVIKTDLPQIGIKSTIVCDMYGYMTEEGKANANLIATAPEMLDVLETIENDANQIPEWLWLKIKNVIKKATE